MKVDAARLSPLPWRFVKSDYPTDEGKIVDADGGTVCDFGDSEQYYPTNGCAPEQLNLDYLINAVNKYQATRNQLDWYRAEARANKGPMYPEGEAMLTKKKNTQIAEPAPMPTPKPKQNVTKPAPSLPSKKVGPIRKTK